MTIITPIRAALTVATLGLALSTTAANAGDRYSSYGYGDVMDEDPTPVEGDEPAVYDCGTAHEVVYSNDMRSSVSVRIDFKSSCINGGGLNIYYADGGGDDLVVLSGPGGQSVLTDVEPGSEIELYCGNSKREKGCCTLDITEITTSAW